MGSNKPIESTSTRVLLLCTFIPLFAGMISFIGKPKLIRIFFQEWEKKYLSLKHDHQTLLEEKCELEEAENDSRLNAQRWEHQHKTTLEKSQLLSDELTLERKSNNILHSELETVQANLEESRNESAYFESLVQRYEQRVFDLEELEVELREKLALLEGAVHFAVWWNTVLMNQVSSFF